MGTIEIVIKWLFFLVISAVYYLVGYVLLKGYVSHMKGLDVETLTKQFKYALSLCHSSSERSPWWSG